MGIGSGVLPLSESFPHRQDVTVYIDKSINYIRIVAIRPRLNDRPDILVEHEREPQIDSILTDRFSDSLQRARYDFVQASQGSA